MRSPIGPPADLEVDQGVAPPADELVGAHQTISRAPLTQYMTGSPVVIVGAAP